MTIPNGGNHKMSFRELQKGRKPLNIKVIPKKSIPSSVQEVDPVEVPWGIIIVVVLFMTALLFSAVSAADPCKPVEALSDKQVQTLYQSYNYGVRYDMGLTLAAIAWKESNAGLYLINISDPSFGVHHILLTTAMKRSNTKDTSYHKNMLASSLLAHDVSASYAIKEIKYWFKYHKGDWFKVWSSYNAGFNIKAGVKYAESIQKKVNLIKRCLIAGG